MTRTASPSSNSPIESQAPADLQCYLRKVALDIGNKLPGADDLTNLRPLAHDVLGQGHAEDVRDPCRTVGIFLGRGHWNHSPFISSWGSKQKGVTIQASDPLRWRSGAHLRRDEAQLMEVVGALA